LFGIDQQQVPAMQAMPLDTFAAAALAAGLSTFLLGIAPDAIIAGLGSFASDFAQNPGRNNRIGGLPFELILTMSDGPPGFADLARNLPPVPGGGPSFVCMTAAGDRPDDWIIAAGGAVANHFDRYLLFDWPDLRGRQPMEVPRLLVQGLARQGVPQGRVTILEAEDRVGQALSLVPDGGRLVLSYASTGGAMTSIRTFAAERGYELEL
jgi:cyanophycin synthetase